MPTVNANKHTAHDLQLAGQMRREDYKTIKHMDKATLAAYLSRVWKRGYDTGYTSHESGVSASGCVAPSPSRHRRAEGGEMRCNRRRRQKVL